MSTLRHDDEDADIIMSYKFLRCLFDLFRERGQEPIVVDAEDTLWRAKEMTTNVCARIGLEVGEVRETWKKVEDGERTGNAMIREWLGTMYESEGIERPDVRVNYSRFVQRCGSMTDIRISRRFLTSTPPMRVGRRLTATR